MSAYSRWEIIQAVHQIPSKNREAVAKKINKFEDQMPAFTRIPFVEQTALEVAKNNHQPS